MNKVDMHVKQLMLRSPMIFPNRWSVLEHIFLHIGTGYGWNRQGTVTSIYDKKTPMPESIDMSDLDHEAQLAKESAERFKEFGASMSESDRCRSVELGMRRLQREYIGANIDVYACNDIGGRGVNAKLLPSLLASVPLGQVPTEGKVNRDWALAADEVATKTLQFLAQQLGDDKGASLPTWQRKQFLELQVQLKAAIDALEPVTKLRAGRQAVAKALQDLFAKADVSA